MRRFRRADLKVGPYILAWLAVASAWGAPTTFDAYDGAEIGARAVSMGGAFVAVADNADAPYWNPGGVAAVPRGMATVMLDIGRTSPVGVDEAVKDEPLRGRHLLYLAAVTPAGALSYRPLGRYTSDQFEPGLMRTVDFAMNMYTLTLASPHGNNLLFGLNINYLNGNIGVVEKPAAGGATARLDEANGWGLDWGFIYRLMPGAQIGASWQSAPGYVYWDGYGKEQMPDVIRAGVALRVSDLLVIASDYERRNYRKSGAVNQYHVGLEQSLRNIVFLRGGMAGESFGDLNRVAYTAGLGIRRGETSVDFSWRRRLSRALPNEPLVHSFAVSVAFPVGAK